MKFIAAQTGDFSLFMRCSVVNQLSFYRNSSNMFITKTNKYIHVCLGVLNVSFHPAYRILSFMYFFFLKNKLKAF